MLVVIGEHGRVQIRQGMCSLNCKCGTISIRKLYFAKYFNWIMLHMQMNQSVGLTKNYQATCISELSNKQFYRFGTSHKFYHLKPQLQQILLNFRAQPLALKRKSQWHFSIRRTETNSNKFDVEITVIKFTYQHYFQRWDWVRGWLVAHLLQIYLYQGLSTTFPQCHFFHWNFQKYSVKIIYAIIY